MQKIRLLKIEQKDKIFFMGVLNPRDVIRLIDIPLKNTDQDCNRPWKEKRVEEISKYVAGKMDISDKKSQPKMAKGYIANCPILCLSSIFEIYKSESDYCLDFPETEEEISIYKGNISVLDGQHRLIAFSDQYIDPSLGNFENYNMGFILFNDLTVNEKREIFMITNDKQDKVESNVLKLIKRWLGLLTEREDYLYKITERLNTEDISPLRGKIIIGGNKISNGFKASQIIKILDKSGLYDKLSDLPEEEQIKFICTYLKGWSEAYGGMFLNSRCFLGKTTGLRYICYLFPGVLDILENQRKIYSKENIINILTVLHNLTIEDEQANESLQLGVRSESGTIAIARLHGDELKKKLINKEERFDVFHITC